MAKKSLSGEISAKVNSKQVNSTFDLNKFKQGKRLGEINPKFKPQEYINFSKPIQDALQLKGIPKGHVSLIAGHSNTGKTTLLAEIATEAQKQGILPVIIITEMKHNWEFWENIGFNLGRDEDGNFNGFFIYADRENLNSIEDVASFISDLLDEQKKGNLPHDLLFLWDSIGSVPAQMSLDKGTNSPMWAAGALSQNFANFINQRIVMSRKESQPYTNTLVCINKVWVEPALMPMAQPKLKFKGGDSMFFDSSLAIVFGNITNSGTQRINLTRLGQVIEFGMKTKISVIKNHITGVTAKDTVVSTADGFIHNSTSSIDEYKKANKKKFADLLGGDNFELIEEEPDGIVNTVDFSEE